MEKLLGILFCGGKGTRLGVITQYISKAFVPVLDRPVFMYGLQMLEKSKKLSEIIILTNKENNAKLSKLGYRTVIQDDSLVNDMFSGLQYIREQTGENGPAVLLPCDNISHIDLDKSIEIFEKEQPPMLIHTKEVKEVYKLCEMGVINKKDGEFIYKPPFPVFPEEYVGVLAPYIVQGADRFDASRDITDIFDKDEILKVEYNGDWFDIGDIGFLWEATHYLYSMRMPFGSLEEEEDEDEYEDDEEEYEDDEEEFEEVGDDEGDENEDWDDDEEDEDKDGDVEQEA